MKKKLITVLLLCAFCLAICACNTVAPEESKQNDATKMQSDTLATEEQADAPSSGSVVRTDGGERPLLTIESVPEYTQLLNSGKLPADFVAYDKIDAIGAFESFIVLSDAYNSDYSSCMYGLVDSEGVRITLYIDSSDKTPSTADSVLSVNKANMRLLSGTGSGIYVSDDVKYQYVSGKLLSVSWENQGMIYTLCGTPMLSDYPHTASTFVGKMLNADMAKQTLNTAFGESAE